MDPSATSRRKRIPNFTPDERLLLAKLVKKWPIIESKLCNTNSGVVAKKQVAWQQLANEYNSQLYVFKRDAVSLRKAWRNIKTNVRKAKIEQRASMKSGGGPSQSPSQQEALYEIVEAVAPALCEIVNKFDSEKKETVMETFGDPTAAPARSPTAAPARSPTAAPAWSHTAAPARSPTLSSDSQDSDTSEIIETESQLNVQNGYHRRNHHNREEIMRMCHLKLKNKLEILTLKSQLKAAQLDVDRNRVLLEKAQLELELLRTNNAGPQVYQ